MTYAQARAKGDTRGMHYAAMKALKHTTIALAAEIYGKRSRKTRRIKQMMEGK